MNTASNHGRPLARSWGLPLLAMELTAAAARPRTFLVRSVYAVVLLLVGYCVLVACLPEVGPLTIDSLGIGIPVLATLRILEMIGLSLVLPVTAAGSIAQERQRQTLDLLFVSRLSPWTIILEKLLSQVVPAINLILLSVPLVAFCYSLGGVSVDEILAVLAELLLFAIRVAAIGILCSTACRTPERALFVTYCTLGLSAWFELICQILFGLLLYTVFQLPLLSGRHPAMGEVLALDSCPWLILCTNILVWGTLDYSLLSRLLLAYLPSLVPTWIYLALARRNLTPGVMPPIPESREPLAGDDLFPDRESRPERREPEKDPIGWRERPRIGLATWWIQAVMICVVLPVLVLVLVDLPFQTQDVALRIIATIYFLIWVLLVLQIIVHAATAIPAERNHRTLDLLRCTPISCQDIIRQKMQRVRRIITLGRVSLGTCVIVHVAVAPSVPYVLLSGYLIYALPEVIALQSMICGLRSKSGIKAVLRSMLILAAWCFLPIMIAVVIGQQGNAMIGGIPPGLSPLSQLEINERIHLLDPDDFSNELVMAIVMSITQIYTCFARIVTMRAKIQKNADTWLR